MTRRPLLALFCLALLAPVAYVVIGAAALLGPVVVPVLLWTGAHQTLMVVIGLVGLVAVLVGLTGIGLARRADVDMPPVPSPRDALDDELDELLDAEATNPRGVRVPVLDPPGGP